MSKNPFFQTCILTYFKGSSQTHTFPEIKMRFVVAKLNEAIANNDLDLARAVIVANFASFQSISHSFRIMGREDSDDRQQVIIIEELVKSLKPDEVIFGNMCLCWSTLVRLYTNALLLNQYDEEMDKDLATAVNCTETKYWLPSDVQKFEWNLRLHFHQALLGKALHNHLIDDWLKGKASLLNDAQTFMPDIGGFCIDVLMTRLVQGEPFLEVFNVFNAVLQGGAPPNYQTGNPEYYMVAGLLYGDAKAFKKYISVDPIKLPAHIHQLFAIIGKACLEDCEAVLTKTCRAKIAALLTRNTKTFTNFLFCAYGFGSFWEWLREGKLDLLDYSLPEWKTRFGRSLHRTLFHTPPKSKHDIEHLICTAPTRLAVAALKRCECLTLEMLDGLPEDRLSLFLRKGALCKLKLPENEPIPGWLNIEESDDYRMFAMKNLITKQLL